MAIQRDIRRYTGRYLWKYSWRGAPGILARAREKAPCRGDTGPSEGKGGRLLGEGRNVLALRHARFAAAGPVEGFGLGLLGLRLRQLIGELGDLGLVAGATAAAPEGEGGCEGKDR